MSPCDFSCSSNNISYIYSNLITSLDGSGGADTADDDEPGEQRRRRQGCGERTVVAGDIVVILSVVLLLVGEVEDGHMALEGEGGPVVGTDGLLHHLKRPEPEAVTVPQGLRDLGCELAPGLLPDPSVLGWITSLPRSPLVPSLIVALVVLIPLLKKTSPWPSEEYDDLRVSCFG
ncbi:hypothetical protein NL676_030091 [Syzygium grande]|nr:hypothetical protein NL676_030091 [Syzygium grande]